MRPRGAFAKRSPFGARSPFGDGAPSDPPSAQPVLDSVALTDGGSGNGTMTLTFDAGETESTPVLVHGYIDTPADADPADGAAVAAGTGAEATFSVETTVGATGVSVLITGGPLAGAYDVFVAASYDDGSTWSNVVSDTGVNFDTTAPTLSGLSGTQTGQTTATAAVTSDETGGTIYFGVRPTADAALTSAQLIAGSGGAGVAWASSRAAMAWPSCSLWISIVIASPS